MSTPTSTCAFCCHEEDLLTRAPFKVDSGDQFFDCNRWLYKDPRCIVTLDPAQLSRGHALAILRKHRKDVLDPALTRQEHHALVDAVQKIGRSMKEHLSCDRVYVATLCDGVEHLHYHLIPRYPTDITGFAFIGQREWSYNSGYRIGPREIQQRVEYLEDLATTIRGV